MKTSWKSLQLIDADLDIPNAKMSLIYLAKDYQGERYILKIKDVDISNLELRMDRTVEYSYNDFISKQDTKTKLELGVTKGFEIIKI